MTGASYDLPDDYRDDELAWAQEGTLFAEGPAVQGRVTAWLWDRWATASDWLAARWAWWAVFEADLCYRRRWYRRRRLAADLRWVERFDQRS